MDQNIQKNKDYKFIPMTSLRNNIGEEVSKDVFYFTDQIANICFIGNKREDWVLIDTGLPYSANKIIKMIEKRFGTVTEPKAIILTHGHFDHIGGLVDLLNEWKNVQVYAHPLEFPYLMGKESYPDPDATVEGGFLAKISPIYPIEPIQISGRLQNLPEDNTVPHLPDWRWIHTPGHSPGHVSLFRESDGFLLSGDAFITVKQDSFYNVLLQTPEIHGPPRYLTTDWKTAWKSVKKLASLNPKTVIAGHGKMMDGESLYKGLNKLAENFDSISIPDYGRYVEDTKH